MVTALSVTAELIGSRTERSAFVYSIVTFLDKIVTGLVVIFIEKWWVTYLSKQSFKFYFITEIALLNLFHSKELYFTTPRLTTQIWFTKNLLSFFFRRCNDGELCPTYNRDTLSIVCASSMMLGLITLLSVSRCLTWKINKSVFFYINITYYITVFVLYLYHIIIFVLIFVNDITYFLNITDVR